MDLEKDIKVALSLLDSKQNINKLGNYNLIQSMTNEKLDLYFKHFTIKDGNVLTVLGSGDSVLQAVSDGAKKVYAFDNNPLAIYLAKLKVAAAKQVSLDKFRNYFFNDDRKQYFNISCYKSVKNYLDYNTRMFWDAIYSSEKFKSHLDKLIIGDKINCEEGFYSYLNSFNYMNTKNRLYCTDIQYYCASVFDILSKIPNDTNFDAVFLSNIFDFMDLKGKVEYPLFIKKDLYDYLNNNGMVAVYSSINGYKNIPLDIIFTDYINVDDKDKVLVYKK